MFPKLFKKNSSVTEDVLQRQPSKLHTCKAFAKDLCTYVRAKKPTSLKLYKTAIQQTDKSAPLAAPAKSCSSASKNNEIPSIPIDSATDREDQNNGTDFDSLKFFDFINKDEADDSDYEFVPKSGGNVADSGKAGFENSLDSAEIDESDEDFDLFYDSLENPEIDSLTKTVACTSKVSTEQSPLINQNWSYFCRYASAYILGVSNQKLSLVNQFWSHIESYYFTPSVVVSKRQLPPVHRTWSSSSGSFNSPPNTRTRKLSPVKLVEEEYESLKSWEIVVVTFAPNRLSKKAPSTLSRILFKV